MTDQATSYDTIVRAEIAIEILNQARAIVTAGVYHLEDTDPVAAETLRRRRRDLTESQQRIRVTDAATVVSGGKDGFERRKYNQTGIILWGSRRSWVQHCVMSTSE